MHISSSHVDLTFQCENNTIQAVIAFEAPISRLLGQRREGAKDIPALSKMSVSALASLSHRP
jgi:hypothetical protein